MSEVSTKTKINNQHEILSVTKDGIVSQREYFKKQIASQDNIGYKIVERNNLVFSTMNLWMGSVDVLTTHPIGIVSPAYTVLKLNEEIVAPEFMNYFMKSNDMLHRYIINSQQGASIVRRNLDKDALMGEQVKIPPLDVQLKIASTLNSFDNLIALFDEKIKKLKQLKRATTTRLISANIDNLDLTETSHNALPKSWAIKSCSDLCTKIFVGIATSTTHAYTKNNGIPILRNQNIRDGEISSEDLLYITREFSEENKSKKLLSGDVISARTGYPGVSAVVNKNYEGCHTFTTLISRPNQKLILPEYYSLFLNSPTGQEIIRKVQAGGAQQNLNVETLKKINLTVPPIEEQKKIVNVVGAIQKNIDYVFAKKKSFLKIKTGLAEDLLSGKVRVPVN